MIIIKYCTIRLENLNWQRPENHNLKIVLERLLLLYSLSCLEKHLASLYQGKII